MSLRTATFSGRSQALGAAIGQRFGAEIRQALTENATLHDVFVPFADSGPGRDLVRRLLALHRARFPDFVAELEGTADGAGVPFEHLFLCNLRGELRGYTGIDDRGECSTCVLHDASHAVIAHNEDGDAIYRGRSYLVRVEPPDAAGFTALCYPGFLPGNAFGCNDHGVCFSVNNVRPRRVREGLGRHFMARSLFEAADVEDALRRLSVEPRAAGFNYTLGACAERRIVNVEVGPEDLDVRELRGVHFHANHYLYLATPQHRFASSLARQRRGESLLASAPPRDRDAVLRVLRDQSDRELPIWRDGSPPDRGVTLLTGVFDLDARELAVYPGPWQHERRAGDALARVPIGEALA